MIAAAPLLKDLKAQVALLEADLRSRSDDPTNEWGQALHAEFTDATKRGRTALTWSQWRDGEVTLAAVAWVLATVFLRFCEDNRLIDGIWLSGPGERTGQAADSETAFYQANPACNAIDWLRNGFSALAALPAGRDLVEPDHNPVWTATIGADQAKDLVGFWRRQDQDGALLHDFTDPGLDTRFLGDLYQDLSEFAKKKYALLQTPVFVEELILDRTLTPALAEFGLEGFKLIDPTCGSGHFLLGAFARLTDAWAAHAPGMDVRERVQRALDSVHGVDLNPFAAAIARFRLTVAALQASGLARLADAPAFRYHIAIGDSLLAGYAGRQGELDLAQVGDDALVSFEYAAEDVSQYPHILDRGRYHVVVGNPPYITVKDPALNDAYRAAYPEVCYRQYALSVPFMDLFFQLAQRGGTGQPAGYIGQITSNSFMKREFGKRVIEHLLSGKDLSNPVDLTTVIDTSGAYIPGHGTPTVILVGRRRPPQGDSIHAGLGIRGEPGQPADPARGLVWTEIVKHLDDASFVGDFVSVSDVARTTLSSHPWSLAGGGAGEVKQQIELVQRRLSEVVDEIGFGAVTREDSAYMIGAGAIRRARIPEANARPLVEGEMLRDFAVSPNVIEGVWPYDADTLEAEAGPELLRTLWPLKRLLSDRVAYGSTQLQRGLAWFEYSMFFTDRYRAPLSIAFAFVATHNHFVLDRGGKVFNRSAPVIKLPAGASEDDHLDLLGVLNSSTACFWLKQVSYPKGGDPVGDQGARVSASGWDDRYEFTGTKLQEFPLPAVLPRERARLLDGLAQRLAASTPTATLAAGEVSCRVLDAAHTQWDAVRARMVFAQEELDWEVYRSYGLIEDDLTYRGHDRDGLALGERAFEIALARAVREGTEQTAWFERHGSTPITEPPTTWPAGYAELVQRRLAAIETNPSLRLLERPENKRRWATRSWEDQERDALQTFVLDKLEDPGLWSVDGAPRVLSVAQLADRIRGDADLVEALRLLAGAQDIDVTVELGKLVADQAVPYLAAYRYSATGLVKRTEWHEVWALQRREDAGEQVEIAVPPKYTNKDFAKVSYWSARGKLDVPKERFILYPDAGRAGDGTAVLGWAGWDHLAQARALATLLAERATDEDWPAKRRLPLVAGLVELEPWLHQWHDEPDPAFGGSPAAYLTGFLDSQLAGVAATRADASGWRAPAPTRGRRRTVAAEPVDPDPQENLA